MLLIHYKEKRTLNIARDILLCTLYIKSVKYKRILPYSLKFLRCELNLLYADLLITPGLNNRINSILRNLILPRPECSTDEYVKTTSNFSKVPFKNFARNFHENFARKISVFIFRRASRLFSPPSTLQRTVCC